MMLGSLRSALDNGISICNLLIFMMEALSPLGINLQSTDLTLELDISLVDFTPKYAKATTLALLDVNAMDRKYYKIHLIVPVHASNLPTCFSLTHHDGLVKR